MRLIKLSLVLIILLQMHVSLLHAQTDPVKFKHISFREGLIQSPISSFLQDDQGFIWLGNLKGLTRYDGYEFKTFVHNAADTNSISNNRVNALLMDSDKNIWIATANGLNRFDRDLEIFESVDIRLVKGGRNYISCITEDQQKNLWIGTFAGLKKLNKSTRKLEDVELQGSILNDGVIFSLLCDKENKIWIGSKSGLRKFDPVAEKEVELPKILQQAPNIPQLKIIVIRQDLSGDIWLGSETSGLFCYNPIKKSLHGFEYNVNQLNGIPSNWIKDILAYDEKTIWIATQNGLSHLNKETNTFTNYKHDRADVNSLSDDAVRALMKDRSSCVWIGTFAGGIDFYYKGNANFLNIGEGAVRNKGLLHPLVNTVIEDKDGSLWVGTYGGGLTHINRKTNISTHYSVMSPKHGRMVNCVKSLVHDENGNLWVGALEGLSSFNKKSGTFAHFDIPIKEGKLSERLINDMLPAQGGVWLATNGGGLKFFKQGKVVLNYQNESTPFSLADNFVTSLLRDSADNLWVGTQNGLNYYDGTAKKFTRMFRNVQGGGEYEISHSHVTCLFKDSKGRLWIGTESGLNYFDNEKELIYQLNNFTVTVDDYIHAITEDEDGNLWFSTDQGLVKLSFKKFAVPFQPVDINITQYSASDGLSSNQFSTNAGIRLQTNEMAFGGINGLSVFKPKQLVADTLGAQIALTEILINNRQVAISEDSPLKKSAAKVETIVLNYDQGLVTFKFAALNYINPEKNTYAYQLTGLPNGEEWQEIGNRRVVNFTNLQPGSYTFNIKLSNNNLASPYIRSVKLVILPPWWKSWWAYLLYAIVTAGFVLAIFAFIEYRRKMRADLYMEHLQNERQQELYQMKLNFFTNISHEIRTPLTLILGPVEKLIDNSGNENFASRQLQLIKNNASRLMKLVTELMDFRKAEDGHMKIHCTLQDVVPFCRKVFEYFEGLAVEKNITYEFKTSKESISLYFDANQMEKVVFNLLSNAFKFTPDNRRIVFRIENDENSDWVNIHVEDNGKGIPDNYHDQLFKNFFQVDDSGRQNIGSGVGLALSKSIVELHKGQLKFKSKSSGTDEPGCTTFTISLRTGREHLNDNEIVSELIYSDEHLNKVVAVDNEEPQNEGAQGGPVKKPIVLIAEDNNDVRSFLADTLKLKYEILEFSNGSDALLSMKHEIPDLIISDIMMPGMDGLTLCTQVKETESTNHIPVILLTARASVNHQVEGLATGADAYISKPFNTKILELTIKNLLTAKEIMREKFSQQLVLQPSNIPLDSPEEKFISKLMGIIEARMEDPEFDVNELVTEIGMSRSVLYKKVQTLTNYSVADLIKEMRLKKAAELFKHTSMSIADVAFAVGFNDRKYFSKEFRKQFNMSPSEFINSLPTPR